MKTAFKKLKVIEVVFLFIGFLLISGFQNCSPKLKDESKAPPSPVSATPSLTPVDCVLNPQASTCLPTTCLFNGLSLTSGQSIQAYQNSSVSYGSACVSESRICQSGALSGSFAFSSCLVDGPASCLFDTQTISHGLSIVAFQNSSVPYGSACVSESRACYNGSLSGAYAFGTCLVAAPASCLFNGQTVAHSAVVIGFQTSTVPYGSTCPQENRVCDNGVLMGSFSFASCNVQAPQSCLFNNQTLAHGQNVDAFQTSVAPAGSQCIKEVRNCDNGILSGSYAFASCNLNAPLSCLFNGQTVADGQSVQAFGALSVSYGATCQSQTRTCSNGVLSGDYAFSSCVVSPPLSCSFNGQEVVSGSSVVAYQAASVPSGSSCVAESRMCSNGTLSGSYPYASCTVSPPPAGSCTFNGQIVLTGTSVIAFQTAAVLYGSSCTSESRACTSGSLAGTYAFSSCTVMPPANCFFNGQTIISGNSVKAYKTSTPDKRGLCQLQNRTCSNGSLSGSFLFSLCQ